MRERVRGGLLVFGCAASYQALQQFRQKGAFKLPRGFCFVSTIGSGAYAYLGYAIESKTRIVVAFRGTENVFDLRTDINWKQVPFPYMLRAGTTHRGFTELYESSVRPQLYNILRSLPARKQLLLTGFSLGGAIATIAALDIANNSRFRHPAVCTYGSPKVGDPEFAAAYNRKVKASFRVVNTKDVVPRLPPSNVNAAYTHAGKRMPITFRYISPLRNHRIHSYAEALEAAYPLAAADLRKRSPGFLPD